MPPPSLYKAVFWELSSIICYRCLHLDPRRDLRGAAVALGPNGDGSSPPGIREVLAHGADGRGRRGLRTAAIVIPGGKVSHPSRATRSSRRSAWITVDRIGADLCRPKPEIDDRPIATQGAET